MPSVTRETVAPTKRIRISEAQKYILVATVGASIILGATLCAIMRFSEQISFNNKILGAQDEAIRNYTSAIQTTGLCAKPAGDRNTYTDDELKKCNPATVSINEIPNTLKAKILTDLAANQDLNAVQKEADETCVNPNSKEGKNYTYEELRQNYNDAVQKGNEVEIANANNLMQTCSALRIIPDALPSVKNEDALLASLDRIFRISGWSPESLSPGGSSNTGSSNKGLNSLLVSLSVKADSAKTMNVLHNIEHSIRDFDISRATIKWSGEDTLSLQASATAYYVSEATIEQGTQTVTPGDDK